MEVQKYELVFDDIIIKQLQKAAKNKAVKEIVSRMLSQIELAGPNAGKLIDSQLHLYEMKSKTPPIRLYFKHKLDKNEIYVLEFEMKNSEKKQKETINKLRYKVQNI